MFKSSQRYRMIAIAFVTIASLMLLVISGQMLRGQAEEQPFSTLKEEVLKIADEDSGDISVFIETSDGEIMIDEKEVYPAASVIKVPILVEGIRQAELGNLNLDEKLRVESSDIVGGGGLLRLLSDDLEVTPRDLMTFMITVSDNSASNMLIDRLGMDAINQTCIDMGCEDTLLQRYLMDTGAPKDNLTSAKDMAKIMKEIDTGSIVSPEGRDEILRIMRAQKLNSFLPAYQGDAHKGIKIAHKTGGLAGPKIRHDVGMFTLKDSTVYVAVLTRGLSKRTGQRSMAGIGESIMNYLAETN